MGRPLVGWPARLAETPTRAGLVWARWVSDYRTVLYSYCTGRGLALIACQQPANQAGPHSIFGAPEVRLQIKLFKTCVCECNEARICRRRFEIEMYRYGSRAVVRFGT